MYPGRWAAPLPSASGPHPQPEEKADCGSAGTLSGRELTELLWLGCQYSGLSMGLTLQDKTPQAAWSFEGPESLQVALWRPL